MSLLQPRAGVTTSQVRSIQIGMSKGGEELATIPTQVFNYNFDKGCFFFRKWSKKNCVQKNHMICA